MKKVVLLGGGVGSSTFTRALKGLPVELTTIVSAFDDGGSTGAIRRDYGGVALGDFRQCVLASTDLGGIWDQTLNYRFGPGHLYGINVGNLLLKSFWGSSRTSGRPSRSFTRSWGSRIKSCRSPIPSRISKRSSRTAGCSGTRTRSRPT